MSVLKNNWHLFQESAHKAMIDGRLDDAEDFWEAALLESEFFKAGDPRVVITMEGLAETCLRKGKFSRAESLLERAVSMRERLDPEEQKPVAKLLNRLAQCLFYQQNYQKSQQVTQKLIKLLEEKVGAEHRDVIQLVCVLAHLFELQNQHASAEACHARALKIKTKYLGHSHPEVIEVMQAYSECLRKLHRHEEANNLVACMQMVVSIQAPVVMGAVI